MQVLLRTKGGRNVRGVQNGMGKCPRGSVQGRKCPTGGENWALEAHGLLILTNATRLTRGGVAQW